MQISDNTMEIEENFQPELVPLLEPVDIRFTAPPILHQLELLAFALLHNERKKIERNGKKNRKQSILLTRGIKKFKNKEEIIEGVRRDREDEESTSSDFQPSTEFWSRQISTTTDRSKKEKQIFDQINFQKVKNIEYRKNEPKSVVMEQLEMIGSENQQFQQSKSINSRKGVKPILPIREGDSNDSEMNLKSDYPNRLMPKPSISSDTMHLTDRISKEKQTEYENLNSNCILSIATNNQPWNPMNFITESGKFWTPEYQQISMINRSPTATMQHQLNYQQQNPMSWDKISIFQGSLDQYVTPITPVNGIFNNSISSTLNSLWMPNQALAINPPLNTFNSVKIPTSPTRPGRYAESFSPALRSIATSISQTNPSFNDFRLHNELLLLPTMKTMESIYDNQQQQKHLTTHLDRR